MNEPLNPFDERGRRAAVRRGPDLLQKGPAGFLTGRLSGGFTGLMTNDVGADVGQSILPSVHLKRLLGLGSGGILAFVLMVVLTEILRTKKASRSKELFKSEA